jgi:hypothetical protein
MDSTMSPKRTLLIAIALGFIGGFSFVAIANSSATGSSTHDPMSSYSAAG